MPRASADAADKLAARQGTADEGEEQRPEPVKQQLTSHWDLDYLPASQVEAAVKKSRRRRRVRRVLAVIATVVVGLMLAFAINYAVTTMVG